MQPLDKTEKLREDNEIIELYVTNKKSLRQLAEEYGRSKSAIERLVKNAKLNAMPEKKRTNTVRKEKTKYLTTQTKREIQKQSKTIVSEYINVLETINYAAAETISIYEEAKKLIEEIPIRLTDLLSYIDNGLGEAIFDDPKEKWQAKNAIKDVLDKVKDFYAGKLIKLKSLNELGNWVDRFKKYEEEKIALTVLQEEVEFLFKSLDMLDEETYRKLKGYIIEQKPETAHYFDQYETVQPYEVLTDTNE